MKKYVSRTIFSFLAALILCPLLWCDTASASATGCLLLVVKVYDTQTEKPINDEAFFSSLKASVFEDGEHVRDVKFDVEEGTLYSVYFDYPVPYTYVSGTIGENIPAVPEWTPTLTLGKKYDVKIFLPENYELKNVSTENTITPDHYTVSDRTLSFVYDAVIHEAVQQPGMGATFELEFYNGPKPEPETEPEPEPKPEPETESKPGTEPETETKPEPETESEPSTESSSKLTTEIKVPQSSYKLTVGDKKFSLEAAVENGNGLVWQSSDSSVIQVSKDGVITVKGPGKAVVSISSPASDKYTGASVNVSFTVKPKKVTGVKAASPKAGKAKVTWKKAGSVSGYLIKTASDKKFTKNVKTYNIKSPDTASRTISGFKKGTLYVKICAYKAAADGQIKGAYSAVQKVKIK